MRRWLWCLALAACDDGADADADAELDAELDATGVAIADMQPVDSTVDSGVVIDMMPDAARAPLVARAGADQYGAVGVALTLDGSESTGAVAYEWDFGDGTRWDAPRETATAEITYAAPGRYRATLTAIGSDGARRTDVAILSVTRPVVFAPVASSTILRDGEGVVALVPDAGQVVRVVRVDDAFAVSERFDVCADAARLATLADGRFLVTCPQSDALEASDGARVELRYGARPFGVVRRADGRIFATLQGTGEVVELGMDLAVIGRWPAIADARGIATLPDGRLIVTRWRSVDGLGRVAVIDPDVDARAEWTLAKDLQGASDTEIGGVPTWLDQPLVAPSGGEVAFAAMQANLDHGPLFDGEEPAFDTVLRAVVSFVDVAENAEDFEERKQFDGRGFASAGVYSARGDFLFLAMRGSRVIERLDRLTGGASGTVLESGIGVEGLALSADDRWLFANAGLSRELRVWDVSDLRGVPLPAQVLPLLDVEPLDPIILRGKQLFNDSFDPRLSREGYIACAHCHLDGDSDGLTWDFTARGEGLRNTISMLGRMGAGHGPIHWTGNFDEIQDFEHDIRGPFGGEGLLDDAAFAMADTSLGAPKAGLGADLDALAAYATSLDAVHRSPHKTADGQRTDAMIRGAAIFERLECDSCHVPPLYTDSAFSEPGVPRLYDVGTLSDASGQRLGLPLIGVDTPTLLGLFDSAPYLHDGSAATLLDVLITRNPDGLHGEAGDLSPAELADLEAFLLGLDGR